MIRRLVGILVILLVLLIAAFYIFIPPKITISKIVGINGNSSGTIRFLGNTQNASKWLPASGYRIGDHFSSVVGVKIDAGDSAISSWITSLSSGPSDTTTLQWACSLNAGLNPVSRWRVYRMADSIGRDMSRILERLRVFAGKENVYGIPIREVTNKDSFLIMKRVILPAYPSTAQLYDLFGQLKVFSKAGGAQETNNPMVNITPVGKDQFQMMVALPVNKELKATKDISPRKMVAGQFLLTEVKGGPGAIDAALGQLQNYVMDHQRTTMAIPFQSLVTDRSRETDTSRWVTRLYYPIF